MSRFLSAKHDCLTPYTPGEQPRTRTYIKLNTNESPFPPSPRAVQMASEAAEHLELYSDPTARDLTEKMAAVLGVSPGEVIMTNGSDEVLDFAFMAFCDKAHPAVFPDITYGFYPVFAALNGVPYEEIPLKEDFTVCPEDYIGIGKTVFLANPNAPTGIALPLSEIERIVAGNPDSVVVVDEAYVDFGGESAVPLIRKYENLLVTGTFSKSRSLAGGRLGFGAASESLIRDLSTMKFSTNPYNVNRMTMAAGLGMLMEEETTRAHCRIIMENRERTKEALRRIGFTVLPSAANFLFAKHARISGEEIYRKLKERGILVRHFTLERIKDYNRITVGTMEQMEALLAALGGILEEEI